MSPRLTPDWNDLRPFLALARAGSLAGAARRLGTQHSTVSRRIEALEHALGARLVHRGPLGAVLTEEGKRLIPLAQEAERAMDAFTAAAKAAPRVWRVTLPTGIAPLVGPGIAALRQRWPELSVDLQSNGQLADISGGAADIALRMRPVDDPDLVARRLGDVGWSLYASKGYLDDHPYTGDLAGHHLIGLNADLANTPAERWVAAHGSQSKVVLRLGQMADLVATVRSGIGLALLPCILADTTEGLVRLTPEVLVSQSIYLVCRRDVANDPGARQVIRCLTTAIDRAKPGLEGRGCQ